MDAQAFSAGKIKKLGAQALSAGKIRKWKIKKLVITNYRYFRDLRLISRVISVRSFLGALALSIKNI